ncbi:MAG: hypothetical protein ACKN9V_00780 [Pseudomonadota bacterium]
MKKPLTLLIGLVASFVILSCGTQGPGDSSSKKSQIGQAKIILKVFAGYSCASCNEELPKLNQRISNELGSQAALIDSRVYVVAGPNWSKADQQTADRYGRELGLDQFQMMVDNRCQTEYRKYYPGSSCLVPATVITRPNGEVLEVYDPGVLDMDEFMARLKELLNE